MFNTLYMSLIKPLYMLLVTWWPKQEHVSAREIQWFDENPQDCGS